MSVGWNFPSNDYGKVDGISDAGIETFLNDPIDSLVREILQNSIDAGVEDGGAPVRVEFNQFSLEPKQIPDFRKIKAAHKSCLDYWGQNAKANSFFDNSLKMLESSAVTVLKISDYNTTGLRGSNEGIGSDWYNLVKAVGASDKKPGEGGSFGIGKNAPLACSKLRMIFYRTLDIDGNYAFQGISKLVTHRAGSGDTQGQGYYGQRRRNEPLLKQKEHFPGDSPREAPGTDVYVVGTALGKNWDDEIKRSVVRNFFLTIYHEKLVVQVGNDFISHTNIGDYVEQYRKDAKDDDTYFFDALVAEERKHFIEPDFEGLGEVELYLLSGKDLPKRVAMTRATGMLIYEKGHFRTPVQFFGVFHAKGTKLNSLLRNMEPPEHNNWHPKRNETDPNYAKKTLSKIYKWIHEKVRELANEEFEEELQLEDLAKYLPDDFEESEKKSEDEQEPAFDSSPPPPTQIELRSHPNRASRKDTSGTESSDSSDETTDSEGDAGPGEGDQSGKTEQGGGDWSEGSGTSAGGAGDQSSAGGAGDHPVGRRRPVNLRSVRAFCTDQQRSQYNVTFIPEFTGSSVVQIRTVGESDTDEARIKQVTLVGNNDSFEVGKHGTVEGIPLTEGQKISLLVELNESGRRALEVSAYEN